MIGGYKKRIMVVAGGSGGHIFPALGFCQEIRERYSDTVDIVFIAGASRSLAQGKVQVETLASSEFNPIFLQISRTPWGIVKLIFKSISLIFNNKPDVVFGFGGYISVPFILGAKLLGRRSLIHEQNVAPGRANSFLSNFADQIIISFKESENFLKRHRKKLFLASYPLRKSMHRVPKEEALKFFGFEDDLFNVLVVGGSQGCHPINEKFLQALKENRNLSRLQLLHLTGIRDREAVSEAYRALPVRSKVFAFLAEMNYAYSVADLVISRAGAGCIAEILYFGLPSILIPYPYAGAHQVDNARILAERGAAILLEEGKMAPQMFNGLLDIFLDDAMRRRTMAAIAVSIHRISENLKISEVVFL